MSIFRDDILDGKVALITGGGSGINLGIAKQLVAHGASVSLVSRTQEKLDRAAEGLDPEGKRAKGFSADVRNEEQLAHAIAQTIEFFGKIDILVNGAAGNFLVPAAQLSPNGFKSVIDIDTRGTFNATRLCFDQLAANKGVVLNVSATQAFMPTPLQCHVGPAKAAIDKLTQDLALEWGPMGIRVVGLAPGGVEGTEGMKRLIPAGWRDKMLKTLPLKRFSSPDEMGAIAVFLVSDAAAYISGTTLVADGASAMPLSGMFWSMMQNPE